MPLTLAVESLATPPAGGTIATGVQSGKRGLSGLPSALDGTAGALAARGFEGKLGQTLAVPSSEGTSVLVGMGESSALSAESYRTIGAALVRSSFGETSVATSILDTIPAKLDRAACAQAFVEGLLLASYQFTSYKSSATPRALTSVVLTGKIGRSIQQGVDRARVFCDAVALNRDLVNEPPASMTPRIFADVATRVAGENGVEITVWDEHDIARERLGGIVGVSIGSTEPPRLVRMVYTPAGFSPKSKMPTIALVGKGITFDSGGLSLKPSDGMITMKSDMSGAGAVVSVMSVIAKTQPKCRVIGYCCLSENMPGPSAFKLGDILRARNGKTVEIHNTDAEGRLVLMDGLSLAAEDKPDAIIDLATLTGAQIVALGMDITAVMGNNRDLIDQVKAAGAAAGEEYWELPLPAKYRKHLDSSIADMKNIGNAGQAGSIVAGVFLQEFVDGRPWVHLDIAGPSFANADDGVITRGGTGVGVRTLLALLDSFTAPSK